MQEKEAADTEMNLTERDAQAQTEIQGPSTLTAKSLIHNPIHKNPQTNPIHNPVRFTEENRVRLTGSELSEQARANTEIRIQKPENKGSEPRELTDLQAGTSAENSSKTEAEVRVLGDQSGNRLVRRLCIRANNQARGECWISCL